MRVEFNEIIPEILQLAAGKVRGFETGTKLLASQCLYLGVVAKILEEFTLAVDWLREAKWLALIDGTTAISTVQTELVEVILEVSISKNFNNYFMPICRDGLLLL